MFTFVSGNQTHAASSARLLINLAILTENQQKSGKNISVLQLVKDPLFALPAKGNYRMTIDNFKDNGPEDRPCVFDGNSSHVDWVQTLRYQSLILMGLKHIKEPTPQTVAA